MAKFVHFTNCRLAVGKELLWNDLWIDSETGKILDSQTQFVRDAILQSQTIDLQGKIISPGFIECQLNGGWGLDFGVPSNTYEEELRRTNRKLAATGVTSYLPTLTSQKPDVYKKVLPLLAPTGSRDADLGAEPLGTHCEGPFLSKKKPGIHAPAVLQQDLTMATLEACYGKNNLRPEVVRKITLAPELDLSGNAEVVSSLVDKGMIVSLGHTAATHEDATRAIAAGAKMVTHMFNAMPQPHHRDIGVFGVLGGGGGKGKDSDGKRNSSVVLAKRPFFGLITDGVHVSPHMCAIAYDAYPDGCIVVTDSLHVLGLEDGIYAWPNGGQIRKTGSKCTSVDGKTLAGASVTLDECVSNLIKWTGIGIAEGLQTVTEHPAQLLNLQGKKGDLTIGADGDLVILSEIGSGDEWHLVVEEVWKFGRKIHSLDGDQRARL